MKDYKDPTELLDEGFQSAREAREYWKALEGEEQAEYIRKWTMEHEKKIEKRAKRRRGARAWLQTFWEAVKNDI